MDNKQILILSFSSCLSLVLFCLCIRYRKKRVREINEKTNLKMIHDRLKRKNIIKPITESDNNLNEEIKDEKENNFRIIEIIHNEDCV
jgi:hypothetical protein